jgi:hypothetical protein
VLQLLVGGGVWHEQAMAVGNSDTAYDPYACDCAVDDRNDVSQFCLDKALEKIHKSFNSLKISL